MTYWMAIGSVFCISLMLAMSCYLLIIGGEISFGQQAFFGLGAYTAAILTTMFGLPLLAAIAAALVASAGVALVVGAAAIRLTGFRFTLFTLVFGAFIQEALARLEWQISRAGRAVGPEGVLGFSGIDHFHDSGIGPAGQLAILGAGAILSVAAVAYLRLSRFGACQEVVAADALLAEASGINADRVRHATFIAAAAIAGLGGALFAHYATFIDPSNFDLMMGVHAVAYSLIGGVGSVLGPVLGTAFDIVFLEWLRVLGGYRMVAFGTLIVATMIWRPRGFLARPLRLAMPHGRGWNRLALGSTVHE